MVKVILSFFLVVAVSMSSTKVRAAETHILPFKTWKQKKVDEAQAVVSELKREKKPLDQALLNLSFAKDLSANDYFVLYVTPQFKDNREALIQASKHLSPKEVADILAAYQKTIAPGDSPMAVPSPESYEN